MDYVTSNHIHYKLLTSINYCLKIGYIPNEIAI